MNYPISQLFHSVQGEAMLVGTPMYFIRLAGCSVGRFVPSNLLEPDLSALRVLHPRHSICTDFGGHSFLCDTDYHKIATHSVEELLSKIHERWICITGGEPFMHDLRPLVLSARAMKLSVQIETSGTIPIPQIVASKAWITCSPKQGYLPDNTELINEFKFLVGTHTTDEDLDAMERMAGDSGRVYVQPINGVDKIDPVGLSKALAILRKRPDWRLSTQLHKLLGVD